VLDNNNVFWDFTYNVVGALNDIILNRPEVDVINMSLGTYTLFTGSCDNANAWTMAGAAAINTLRANGVITFASSGNDGSGTQMSAPACLSGVVSVGATYDANQATYSFGTLCTDVNPVVDQVACFTNSDPQTDIMAPGCRTTSTGNGGGNSTYCGTSQASPHAAACAALFLDANPALTPDQIESRLETSSVWVTDTTNGLSFPRIDCHPLSTGVGGIAELPPLAGASAEEAGAPAGGSGWSAGNYAALAGGLAAAAVVLSAGWWYAGRRWLR
jgi:subtilisin family serine protease